MARVVVATAHHHILDHLAHALRAHGHEVVGLLSAGALPVMAESVARVGCPRFEIPLMPGELHIGRAMRKNPAYASDVRSAVAGLAALDADFLLGWAINVLPRFLLEAARHPINVHPSDLPRYRGGFPLEAQILNGDRKLFISVHHTVAAIDAGGVLARSQPLKIKRTDTTTSLLERCLPVGAALATGVVTHWAALAPVQPPPVEDPLPHAWGLRRTPDELGRLRNEGVLGRLRIAWNLDSPLDIARAARAFDMIGGALTSHGTQLFRITRAKSLDPTTAAAPGEVLAVGDGSVDVQARGGIVRVFGAFAEGGGQVVPGDHFESTEPISRLLPFANAER